MYSFIEANEAICMDRAGPAIPVLGLLCESLYIEQAIVINGYSEHTRLWSIFVGL